MVFVCVHGAGYSGLSFACFAKDAVEKGGGKVGALAFDARGHGALTLALFLADQYVNLNELSTGKTTVAKDEDGNLDMSLEALSDDHVRLLKEMFPVKTEAPSVVLIGHSMVSLSIILDSQPDLIEVQGGAVAVDACPKLADVVDVVGLSVLDVVEGWLHHRATSYDTRLTS